MSATQTRQEHNPLAWLPQPGQGAPTPGGILWVESWECNMTNQQVEGKIVLAFSMEREAYGAMMEQQKMLKAEPKQIESQESDVSKYKEQ